jgi:3-hydroxymyristoyl/3-hydroxydecanoyl-(acyl carrier protein) dehydratase
MDGCSIPLAQPDPCNSLCRSLRYPFLLVDRVVEWEKEKYAVGYKCVTINDNFFPGHFPERAIMPGGVNQLTAAAAACTS